jgi:hypothetical protein
MLWQSSSMFRLFVRHAATIGLRRDLPSPQMVDKGWTLQELIAPANLDIMMHHVQGEGRKPFIYQFW